MTMKTRNLTRLRYPITADGYAKSVSPSDDETILHYLDRYGLVVVPVLLPQEQSRSLEVVDGARVSVESRLVWRVAAEVRASEEDLVRADGAALHPERRVLVARRRRCNKVIACTDKVIGCRDACDLMIVDICVLSKRQKMATNCGLWRRSRGRRR